MNEKKTILIIEDESSLVSVIKAKFVKEGFVVLKAGNGVEGLKMALRKHPDLILLDIIMPKMDGMTMLKKLRTDTWGKSVPVIMLTNLSDTAKVADAIDQGSYDYLVKSNWKLKDVVAKVRERLGG
jgi:DNA-binding response OmpR family regulator